MTEKARILVVDDTAPNVKLLEQVLLLAGYEVVTAFSGEEGLAKVVFARPDLVLCDVVMPGGMSGRELAEAARALRTELRVLYTSGYNENVIVHHGRLDSGIHLLAKPYRRADLARKVREVLVGGGER